MLMSLSSSHPRPELAISGVPGGEKRALWWSESAPPPARVVAADERTTADAALHSARSGEGLAWVGDWRNARQLLAAMGRRLRAPRPRGPGLADLFRAERQGKRIEQEVLSRLAVPLGPGWESPLRHAPSLEAPLSEAFGQGPDRPALMPLREILGAIGAHEWLRRGVPVPAPRAREFSSWSRHGSTVARGRRAGARVMLEAGRDGVQEAKDQQVIFGRSANPDGWNGLP